VLVHRPQSVPASALDHPVDKIRINPGNIGGMDRFRQVLRKAKDKGLPMRIGVNAGSLEKDLLEKYGEPCPEAMVESALNHARILEDNDFFEFKISVKASDVFLAVAAYQGLSEACDYPLHLGITEAGGMRTGSVKSAIGMGSLLWAGIGDTIRVSLSADPTEEVRVGIDILKSLGLRRGGLTFVSCPSCGRADVDLVKLAKEVEDEFKGLNEEIHIAVMGCEVNGPGEARAADIGVAGGRGIGLIFKNGEVIRKVAEKEIVQAMREEVDKFITERKAAKTAAVEAH